MLHDIIINCQTVAEQGAIIQQFISIKHAIKTHLRSTMLFRLCQLRHRLYSYNSQRIHVY